MILVCAILGTGLLICMAGWADTAFQLRSALKKLAALSAGRLPEFDIAPEDQA